MKAQGFLFTFLLGTLAGGTPSQPQPQTKASKQLHQPADGQVQTTIPSNVSPSQSLQPDAGISVTATGTSQPSYIKSLQQQSFTTVMSKITTGQYIPLYTPQGKLFAFKVCFTIEELKALVAELSKFGIRELKYNSSLTEEQQLNISLLMLNVMARQLIQAYQFDDDTFEADVRAQVQKLGGNVNSKCPIPLKNGKMEDPMVGFNDEKWDALPVLVGGIDEGLIEVVGKAIEVDGRLFGVSTS